MDSITQEEELLEKQFESEILKISTIIPENEIIKECVIGEGGFGKVYKGMYNKQKVAIKKIKLQDKDEEIFESLLNEIKVIVKADNPEIPKFFGIMKKKGKYHLIFEFVQGNSLKLLYPKLTHDQKIKISYDLCGILQKFHAKNLIHRDIKPGNVMIEENNLTVKLIDFGVSKIASHTSTYTKAQIGTVPYMSPEQFQIDLDKFGDPDCEDVKSVPISIKSDIWSLGVMISEIFSGVRPYFNISKKHNPTEQMITSRLSRNSPFPIPKGINEDIKLIVQRATEVNPEQRATAEEVKEMFSKLIIKREEQKLQQEMEQKLTITNNTSSTTTTAA